MQSMSSGRKNKTGKTTTQHNEQMHLFPFYGAPNQEGLD